VATGLNAAKPVVVDDTAYLAYARQIAAHPLDPYGFSFFWWTVPDDAFEVLCPPVVPYWLALGIGVFGEHPALLKLWMLPFVGLLVWALDSLLRRLARGSEAVFLPLLMLSPAVLPTINLMLDIPAAALGLAAIVVFMHACERNSWSLAALAGIAAALAMQTKYTGLLIPPAIAFYGLTRWRRRPILLSLLAVTIAALLFAGWETLLVAKYGRSHFLFHLSERQPAAGAGLEDYIQDKLLLLTPLAGYLGCLGIGVGLVAATALGIAHLRVAVVAAIWAAVLCWIALTPAHWSAFPSSSPLLAGGFATVFWTLYGYLLLAALAACSWVLLVRRSSGWRLRVDPDAIFLVGWLFLELAGYFAMTPFGAARRVIGLTLIGGILTARVASRLDRLRPERRPARWMVAFGAAAGLLIASLDTLDAYPEKNCADRAAALLAARNANTRIWFAGHWGFQYYCGRHGMQQIAPGESTLRAGEFLVLPIHPDELAFYRPHIGSLPIQPPETAVEKIDEVVWDDFISGQTLPNFYGGFDPVVGRDHPRLRVVIYRMVDEWTVPGR
jgi:4-amino-4-deoxy-L-arabinose transferase-like glycosyltransferase